MAINNLPHIVITIPPKPLSFTSTSRGGPGKSIPQRDRQSHSAFLQKQFQKAWQAAEDERTQVAAYTTRTGVYLEFKSYPNVELITKSLEDMHSKQVRLLNVRQEEITALNESTDEIESHIITYATVFVANDKIQYFLKKLEDYKEKTLSSGKPKNANLINSIADLYKALLVESFWQDAKELIPSDNPEWCEVWLSSETDEIIERFNQLLNQQNINAKSNVIRFPERAVKLIQANRSQLEQLTRLSDDIAEYRRAKETTTLWIELPNRDQAEWVANLLERLQINQEAQVSVCLLDTGVNRGHPLLEPILVDQDCQSVDPNWGVEDHNRHGTLMAGVIGYGNLMDCLSSSEVLEIRHSLESVKILPPPPDDNKPDLWGYVTSQAIYLAEIQAPERKRIVCMAVSSEDTRDRGRPSSWSAAIDQITAGAEDNTHRLIILSAGNTTNPENRKNYPDAQITESIHDPAQSWNALTVGAYTELDTITDATLDGYSPIASRGGLSPFTTTSVVWEDKWPIKPEIVLEGGNLARDSDDFATECDDFSMLSTFYDPQKSHFYPFNMTSAATAQAAWFAAQIQATYPDFWPETIRALMIHSAEWTESLRREFGGNGSKTDIKTLMRVCGYGVPNLQRALYSAENSLTLISQAELQPFRKKEKGGYTSKDMHLYSLPWPEEVLLDLPDGTKVEMRITLSYFIEPGPGEIGWQDRYRYASHALRFELNSPEESQEDFVKRINAAARNDDEGRISTQSPSKHWVIGEQTRDKGSIHSDIWQGTAAQLASSNLIAISPRIGWWRERSHLNRWNRHTRYALVVSIATPEETVDLYTPVANKIGITVPIPVQV
ncbi:MAG: S8 family peptidase [Chloroflexi bacterium AL-W]|nr:S8 family peptidase [Chloroflexi bacterium AL-N1]NOK71269.1 S8 family peptidase [Chloroflexi bacterium AL-N10]NOK77644.1 S8 family peptidase [Chloroflexi bacterium AL-N5]NOK84495.1 S8 family peptidase [Chloroflexi bacterium AL-W]NOK92946.1 S8 family peptidase [Chloroflexi bacterium AL-N15]